MVLLSRLYKCFHFCFRLCFTHVDSSCIPQQEVILTLNITPVYEFCVGTHTLLLFSCLEPLCLVKNNFADVNKIWSSAFYYKSKAVLQQTN